MITAVFHETCMYFGLIVLLDSVVQEGKIEKNISCDYMLRQ